jgi:hypothetical protein
MRFQELEKRLGAFEQEQHARLRSNLLGKLPFPEICNGKIIFASLENDPTGQPDEDLPVVLGVGSNYGQNPSIFSEFAPYYGADPFGNPIVNSPVGSVMRTIMDLTFNSYTAAPYEWQKRFVASSSQIKVPSRYILIATNFCPFISFLSWQDPAYWAPYRAELLSSLGGEFKHLIDIAGIVGDALWVGHGMDSEVPVLFRCFQRKMNISQWLLSFNLNGRNRKSITGIKDRIFPQPPPVSKTILLTDNSFDS